MRRSCFIIISPFWGGLCARNSIDGLSISNAEVYLDGWIDGLLLFVLNWENLDDAGIVVGIGINKKVLCVTVMMIVT